MSGQKIDSLEKSAIFFPFSRHKLTVYFYFDENIVKSNCIFVAIKLKNISENRIKSIKQILEHGYQEKVLVIYFL